MDGAEGAARDDAFNNELARVDLPVLPAPPQRRELLGPQPRGLAAAAPRPGGRADAPLRGAAEVALELLVQALEVDLVRAHEPRVPARAGGLPHAWWSCGVGRGPWRRAAAAAGGDAVGGERGRKCSRGLGAAEGGGGGGGYWGRGRSGEAEVVRVRAGVSM